MQRAKTNLQRLGFDIFYSEEVCLLSKITGDPTVGSFLAKEQSGSTHRGLHVCTGFGSFQQTP